MLVQREDGKYVDSGIIPYMRSIVINFSAVSLKPNTKVYAYFDGIGVSQYSKMTGNPTYGTDLITDSAGKISGQFRIPAGKFTTGTKIFTLINSAVSSTANTDCVAVTTFTASGTQTYDAGLTLSTMTPSITVARSRTPKEIVADRQTTISPSSTSFKDPIAQTIFVSGNQNGIFATKIDVYFKSRPTSGNIPITLQIRETVNGYPSDIILPFSSVTLYPKDINPTDDGSAPSQFVFPSPVYLKNNQEYCFVLLPAGNNQEYQVWTAEIGETVIGTTQIIDKQPNMGHMIVSGNGASWTVYENRDIKFSLHSAEFDITNPGYAYLKNKNVDYLILNTKTDYFNPGDYVVSTTGKGTVLHYDRLTAVAQVLVTTGYFSTGDALYGLGELSGTIVSSTSSTTITGTNTLFSTEAISNLATAVLVKSDNTVIGTISSITTDTSITLTANAAVTLSGETIFIRKKTAVATVDSKTIHALAPSLSYIDFNNTNIDWQYKLYSTAAVDPGSYKQLSVRSSALDVSGTVFSNSYENNTLSLTSNVNGTFMIKGAFTSESLNVSPVLDLQKVSTIASKNYICATDPRTSVNAHRMPTEGYLTTAYNTIAQTGLNKTTGGVIAYSGSGTTYFTDEVTNGAVLRDQFDNVIGVVKQINSDTQLVMFDDVYTNTSNLPIIVDNEASNFGPAFARYISKNIILSEGQDAEDLRVYLDADFPAGTSVKVYARLWSANDSQSDTARPWVQLTQSSFPGTLGFGDYVFTLKQNAVDELTLVGGLNSSGIYEYVSNGISYSTFKIFSVKVAMFSEDDSIAPRIRSLRAIALQA